MGKSTRLAEQNSPFILNRIRVIPQSFACHGGDNLEENIIYISLAWLNLTQSTLAMDRATNNSFKSNYFKILSLICWNI